MRVVLWGRILRAVRVKVVPEFTRYIFSEYCRLYQLIHGLRGFRVLLEKFLRSTQFLFGKGHYLRFCPVSEWRWPIIITDSKPLLNHQPSTTPVPLHAHWEPSRLSSHQNDYRVLGTIAIITTNVISSIRYKRTNITDTRQPLEYECVKELTLFWRRLLIRNPRSDLEQQPPRTKDLQRTFRSL